MSATSLGGGGDSTGSATIAPGDGGRTRRPRDTGLAWLYTAVGWTLFSAVPPRSRRAARCAPAGGVSHRARHCTRRRTAGGGTPCRVVRHRIPPHRRRLSHRHDQPSVPRTDGPGRRRTGRRMGGLGVGMVRPAQSSRIGRTCFVHATLPGHGTRRSGQYRAATYLSRSRGNLLGDPPARRPGLPGASTSLPLHRLSARPSHGTLPPQPTSISPMSVKPGVFRSVPKA